MRWIIFFCFYISSIYSNPVQPSSEDPSPIINFESEPSSFVGNVNVITGAYQEFSQDLIIPGAEPLILQRSYCSMQSKGGSLPGYWYFNHEGTFTLDRHKHSKSRLLGPFGCCLIFTSKVSPEDKQSVLTLDWDMMSDGFTNCAEGRLSGRTNRKNFLIKCDDHQKDCWLQMGSGSRRHYRPNEDNLKKGMFLLRTEYKPNGNRICYEYDDHYWLKKIETKNANGKILTWASFYYPASRKEFKAHPYVRVKASDGRRVTYHICNRKQEENSSGMLYLEKVVRPEAPVETYLYQQENENSRETLTERIYPDQRRLLTEYYSVGTHKAHQKWIHVERDDKLYRRVKRQLAPVGTDPTPIPIAEFVYDLKKKKTEVYDVYHRPTYYFYSDESRLTCIQRLHYQTLKGIPIPVSYCGERFYWGAAGSSQEGHLICRTITQSIPDGLSQQFIGLEREEIVGCKTYEYDKRGNVTCETLWGNLTGISPQPVKLDSRHYPKNNGCDSHRICYEYSDDGFNLLLKEIHPTGKVILYTYQPKTDLMTAKLTLNGSQIVLREFYTYNEDAVLVQTIRDDGCTPNVNDLTGVTERHLTALHPKMQAPCIGLPEVVEELYWDKPAGQFVSLKKMANIYDAYGHLLQQHHYDNAGNLAYTLNWQYNEQGLVVAETDALGQLITKKYDANGNLTFEQGPRTDYYKNYEYDFANRLIRVEEVDSQGHVLAMTYRYDLAGNKTAEIDSHGNETLYRYDEFNRLIRVMSPSIMAKNGTMINPTTCYAYDCLGNRIAITDARGYVTRKEYNLRGQPTTIYYPDSTEEHFEYLVSGKLAKSIDRQGIATVYEYDIFDRVIKKTQWNQAELLTSRTYLYSTFNLMQEIDESGHAIIYSYDGAGRLISKHEGYSLTFYGYDSLGRQAAILEWVGSAAFINKIKIYDHLNRVIEEQLVDEAGQCYHRTSYEYMPDGQQTAVTTYGGAGPCTTRTLYNWRKQPLVIQDAEGQTTVTDYNHYYHNLHGQIVLQTTTTDPDGNRIQTTYDVLNQPALIERYDAMGELTQRKEIIYDATGNKIQLIETVIADGKPINRIVNEGVYDSMNRLEHYIESVDDPQVKHTFYQYNAKGQKEAILRPDGCVVQYTYDAFGRLGLFQASDGSFAYRYTYTTKGWPIKVEDLTTGETTERAYDVNGKLVQEKLQNELIVFYAYDKIGRPTQMTLPDQSQVAYSYQGPYLHQIKRLDKKGGLLYQHIYASRDQSGNPLKEQLAYSAGQLIHCYNRLGKRIQSVTQHWQEIDCLYTASGNLLKRELTDSHGKINCAYQYDALNQIQEETSDEHHTYQYDSAYNCLIKDGKTNTINQLNQLIQSNDTHYLYDTCGNCIQKIAANESLSCSYDALDRLIQVQINNKIITYCYDAFNRRISKTINGQIFYYLYADQNEIGMIENQELQEFRLLGTGKGAEIGAAVAIEIKKKVYVPLHDQAGHVSCLLDEQGEVVESYRYTAFGEESIYDRDGCLVLAAISPWRYSSKRHDTETGWIYFGRRYYDPDIGRWITPDPLGQEGGPNLYAYVLNNPLAHIDLYGLFDLGGFFGYVFGQLFSWLGNVISCVSYEAIPIPVVKDLFRGAGHYCQHGNFNEFVPSYREQHSYNGRVGVWQDTKSVDIYVNGIRTSDEEIETRYLNASNACNESIKFYTYNATHGSSADLLEWLCQRVGVPTNSVNKLVTNIRERIADMGGTQSDGRIRLWAHSQGGEISSSLQQILTKEELTMIDVKTYGSANLFTKGDFRSVTHYASTRDWVPLLSSPIQYAKALQGSRPDVIFLPSRSNEWMDHSFDGETYQYQHRQDINHIR